MSIQQRVGPNLGREGARKSLFITGIDGFVGCHLRSVAQEMGFLVSGLARGRHVPEEGIYQCDINNEELLTNVVQVCRPDYVVNLAGMSHFVDGDVTCFYTTNILGTRNLLSALSKLKQKPTRVLLVSSGNVYGISSAEKLVESLPLRPISDYSVSKIAMELLVPWWSQFFEIGVARPFNHIGRGQRTSFLIPKLVNAFIKRLPFIELGDTSTIRDYSDVRDIVRVYLQLLIHPQLPSHPVNICTGLGHSTFEVISYLKQLTGHNPEIKSSVAMTRSLEIPRLVGDPSFLRSMGIEPPTSDLRSSLDWMLSE
jgi:nucleoside-diphosphate-sugar epimerase